MSFTPIPGDKTPMEGVRVAIDENFKKAMEKPASLDGGGLLKINEQGAVSVATPGVDFIQPGKENGEINVSHIYTDQVDVGYKNENGEESWDGVVNTGNLFVDDTGNFNSLVVADSIKMNSMDGKPLTITAFSFTYGNGDNPLKITINGNQTTLTLPDLTIIKNKITFEGTSVLTGITTLDSDFNLTDGSQIGGNIRLTGNITIGGDLAIARSVISDTIKSRTINIGTNADYSNIAVFGSKINLRAETVAEKKIWSNQNTYDASAQFRNIVIATSVPSSLSPGTLCAVI